MRAGRGAVATVGETVQNRQDRRSPAARVNGAKRRRRARGQALGSRAQLRCAARLTCPQAEPTRRPQRRNPPASQHAKTLRRAAPAFPHPKGALRVSLLQGHQARPCHHAAHALELRLREHRLAHHHPYGPHRCLAHRQHLLFREHHEPRVDLFHAGRKAGQQRGPRVWGHGAGGEGERGDAGWQVLAQLLHLVRRDVAQAADDDAPLLRRRQRRRQGPQRGQQRREVFALDPPGAGHASPSTAPPLDGLRHPRHCRGVAAWPHPGPPPAGRDVIQRQVGEPVHVQRVRRELPPGARRVRVAALQPEAVNAEALQMRQALKQLLQVLVVDHDSVQGQLPQTRELPAHPAHVREGLELQPRDVAPAAAGLPAFLLFVICPAQVPQGQGGEAGEGRQLLPYVLFQGRVVVQVRLALPPQLLQVRVRQGLAQRRIREGAPAQVQLGGVGAQHLDPRRHQRRLLHGLRGGRGTAARRGRQDMTPCGRKHKTLCRKEYDCLNSHSGGSP